MSEKEWLKTNRYYDSIDESKLENIFYFTFVWNIFEKECCNKKAKIGSHPRNIASNLQTHLSEDVINHIYTYFRDRYVINETVNDIFNSFDFSSHGQVYKTFVEEKLLNTESSHQDKIQALLYIAFRLRNNLYHGEKEVKKLYEQNENFRQINILLMAIIDKKVGCI